MNDALTLLRNRRSVAPLKLAGPGPEAGEIEAMLTIAARVPDHGRLVPWRFIVIEGEARERLGATIEAAYVADNPQADETARRIERTRLALAPLVVAVVSRAKPHPKIPEWEQILSAGAVCMNLLDAAHAMGFSASWLSGWHSYDRRVLDALGLAAAERIAGYVHIGRSAEAPPDRPRPALADIVSRY